MRLATWNVNSLKMRLPRLLELLAQYRPDVVFLQETKCEAEAFPEAELGEAGYRAVHHSAGRWAGVALLAPLGADVGEVCAGLAGEPDVDEARWVEATVAGVRAVSVYVPNGRAVGSPAYAAKLAFLEAAAARVRELAREPLAVAGDFNVCPADRDVYDPVAFAGSTHVTAAERDRFRAILDGGVVDAFRHLHSETVGYTWWDYRQGHFHRRMGLRIDAILLSQPLAERLRRCGIDRDYRKGSKPSDHAPLLAQLEPVEEPLVPDASDSRQE